LRWLINTQRAFERTHHDLICTAPRPHALKAKTQAQALRQLYIPEAGSKLSTLPTTSAPAAKLSSAPARVLHHSFVWNSDILSGRCLCMY
jgi:hypothetical protein